MLQSSKYEYVLIQIKFFSRKSGSLCLETDTELEPRKTVKLTACSFQHRYMWFSELFPSFWKAEILLAFLCLGLKDHFLEQHSFQSERSVEEQNLVLFCVPKLITNIAVNPINCL